MVLFFVASRDCVRPKSIPYIGTSAVTTHPTKIVLQFLVHDGCIRDGFHCKADWLKNWQARQGWDHTAVIEYSSKWPKYHKWATTDFAKCPNKFDHHCKCSDETFS
jgi:hypothetical protein